jgi:hypothetical protein
MRYQLICMSKVVLSYSKLCVCRVVGVPAQQAALDELKNASVKAAEDLKINCPTFQMLTPTGRVEAMEKRLDATLDAVKTVQPALLKSYNSLSDEQKARFNSPRFGLPASGVRGPLSSFSGYCGRERGRTIPGAEPR